MEKKLPQNPDEWTKPTAKPPSSNGKSVPLKPAPKPAAPGPSGPLADAFGSGTPGGAHGPAGDAGGPRGKSSATTTECLSINGIGDRMHHLAMSHSAPHNAMRQSQLVATKAPGKIRPMSKAECARSRGAKNFCDPSHPAGCGGKFCGQALNGRRADDFI